MTPLKVLQVFNKLMSLIEGVGYSRQYAKRIPEERMDDLFQFDHTDRIELMNHLFFMCNEGLILVGDAMGAAAMGEEKRAKSVMEKAMRWLGFVQGMLVAGGVCSIKQMKILNSPDVSDEV